MRFPMDRPVKVVMLGAGGTGGYVAPYLFRLLHMLDRPARFIICDGDLVEAKNLDRQNFVKADLGENKARVLSERYSAVLGMETEYVPNFIETLPELMTLSPLLENLCFFILILPPIFCGTYRLCIKHYAINKDGETREVVGRSYMNEQVAAT